MPYIGPTPFLPRKGRNTEKRAKMFQCPISGPLHFYMKHYLRSKDGEFVSMPYIGPTPFLQHYEGIFCEQRSMFQCPISGPLHFYNERCEIMDDVMNLFQCPISGPLHFYKTVTFRIACVLDVSMPYIGPTPFLRDYECRRKGIGLFQCPISGPLHFYIGEPQY